MQTEHVFLPFILNKSSKMSVRLGSNLELKGHGWHCGLKSFMLDKQWSLINEYMTILYTNGYKSVVKPKKSHSLSELEKVLEEMFGKPRVKRSCETFEDIMNNDECNDDKRDSKKEATPPPGMPVDPKPENIDEKILNEQESVPTTTIKDENIEEEKIKEREVTPPPTFFPMDVPAKPEVDDERMVVVSYPTDEEGKSGNKYYIVYKKLEDAFLYSSDLPETCSTYTYDSVKFTYNETQNRYKVNFDPKYIRAIHLSNGFSRALGFPEMVFNNNISKSDPKVKDFHNYIQITLNDIITPINCGDYTESVLACIPSSYGQMLIAKIYDIPIYLKMNVSSIAKFEFEFKDLHGNPIYGDNAAGHLWLEFVKM